jgi:hypothetical protein
MESLVHRFASTSPIDENTVILENTSLGPGTILVPQRSALMVAG